MRVRTVVNFLACLLFIYILCVYGPRVFEIHLSIYLSIDVFRGIFLVLGVGLRGGGYVGGSFLGEICHGGRKIQ